MKAKLAVLFLALLALGIWLGYALTPDDPPLRSAADVFGDNGQGTAALLDLPEVAGAGIAGHAGESKAAPARVSPPAAAASPAVAGEPATAEPPIPAPAPASRPGTPLASESSAPTLAAHPENRASHEQRDAYPIESDVTLPPLTMARDKAAMLRDGLVVDWTEDVSGQKFKRFWGRVLIDAPAAVVWRALMENRDQSSADDKGPSNVIKRDKNREWRREVKDYVIKKIEFVNVTTRSERDLRVEWHMESGNMKYSRGGWFLTPVRGKTLATYYSLVDPDMPFMVMSMYNKENRKVVLEKCRALKKGAEEMAREEAAGDRSEPAPPARPPATPEATPASSEDF